MGRLVAILVWGLVRALWWLIRRTTGWLFTHPRITLTGAAAGVSVWFANRAEMAWWWGPVILFGVPVALVLLWMAVHFASFKLEGWLRIMAWFRRWFTYAPKWDEWMSGCGLARDRKDGTSVIPRLTKVECTPAIDRLFVRIPVGLNRTDFDNAVDDLANAAESEECRVRLIRPALVAVEFRRKDALAQPIAALPIPKKVTDLSSVVIGVREDGHPWQVPVLDVHTLVAGRSRAGKGSVMWSMILALAPAIYAGLVRITFIDPKSGMEGSFGAGLLSRLEFRSPESMVQAMTEFADRMDDRAMQLRGIARKFTPSVETPLEILVVDELASLTVLAGPILAREAEQAMGRVATKGAGPGFVLWGFVQDPRKDTVAMRNLFTNRVCLGVDSPSEVDMVLGDDMYERGARANEIPKDAKGVAYVREDGVPEPFRVRAAYPTDDDIRAAGDLYTAPENRLDGLETTEQVTEPITPVPVSRPRAISKSDAGEILPQKLIDLFHQQRRRDESTPNTDASNASDSNEKRDGSTETEGEGQ